MSDLGIDESAALTVPADIVPGTSLRQILDSMPEARRLILNTAFRCLGARKFYFDKAEGGMVFEPDYKTQLDAVKFLASYQEGLPVQTSLAVTVGDRPDDDLPLDQALQRSPALRERVAKLLSLPTT